MLLLYPVIGKYLQEDFLIYIPLCFYFIAQDIWQVIRHRLIYIPLCFYFICIVIFSVKLNDDLHSTMLLLYRSSSRRTLQAFCDLHSTMLLLYQKRAANIERFAYIYIPLCFYFIWSSDGNSVSCKHIYIPLCFYFIGTTMANRPGEYAFTFHYASTLS